MIDINDKNWLKNALKSLPKGDKYDKNTVDFLVNSLEIAKKEVKSDEKDKSLTKYLHLLTMLIISDDSEHLEILEDYDMSVNVDTDKSFYIMPIPPTESNIIIGLDEIKGKLVYLDLYSIDIIDGYCDDIKVQFDIFDIEELNIAYYDLAYDVMEDIFSGK